MIKNKNKNSLPAPEVVDIERADFEGGGGGGSDARPDPKEFAARKPILPSGSKDSAGSVAMPSMRAENFGPGARDVALTAVRGEYRYAMLGLSLGIIAILVGGSLCLHGVAGSTSWTMTLLGLRSEVNDAGPGVVLFIVGLAMVFTTRPKVRMKDIR